MLWEYKLWSIQGLFISLTYVSPTSVTKILRKSSQECCTPSRDSEYPRTPFLTFVPSIAML